LSAERYSASEYGTSNHNGSGYPIHHCTKRIASFRPSVWPMPRLNPISADLSWIGRTMRFGRMAENSEVA
jgi:hypothetical protein